MDAKSTPRKPLPASQRTALLASLQARFEANMDRHRDLAWGDVAARLLVGAGDQLWTLQQMETTGGEPDVVGLDARVGAWVFVDCAPESPKGRRSLCYDGAALDARKENKPKGSAMDVATAMGVEMLTEEEYHGLQRFGPFDTKTSSWLRTPADVRQLGGAIFGDFRFGRVFVYHNGAESYYAARGFRGLLRV
ncbi:MAG: DUF4256 domain-containing protein [Planctomycetota bacterium]